MGAMDDYDVPETGGGAVSPAAPASAPAPRGSMDDYGDGPSAATTAAPVEKPNYAAMPLSTAVKEGVKSFIPASAQLGAETLSSIKNTALRALDTGELPGADLARAGDAWLHKKAAEYAPKATAWLDEKTGYKPPQSEEEYNKTVQPLTDIGEHVDKTWGSGLRMADAAAHEKVKEIVGPERMAQIDKATGYTPVAPDSPEASGAGFKEAVATKLPNMLMDVSTIAPAFRAGTLGKAGEASRAVTPVSEAELGRSFHEAASASDAARNAAYARTAAVPGSFNMSAITPILQDTMKGLEKKIGVGNWQILDKSPSLANVKGAVNVLRDQLGNINPQNFNMATLETIRRDMRTFAENASGTEQHIIGNLISDYDKGVGRAATTPGMFSGNGAEAVGTMADARKAHVSHLDNFVGNRAPQAVRSAMKKLGDLSQAGEDEFHAAGTVLGTGLRNPGDASVLHSHLINHVPTATLNDFAKERLLTGTQAAVDKNLANPVAQKVFGADLARAQKINKQQGAPTTLERAAPYVKHALRAASIPAGFMHSGVTGALLGPLVEQGLEKFIPSFKPGAKGTVWDQYQGIKPGLNKAAAAPMTTGQAVNPLTWLNPMTYGPAVKAAPATIRTGTGLAAAERDGREEHARGGKVGGHQHLVDQLFHHIERAKKEEKGRTSALLNHPDEHIAKALNVAQAAI